MAIAFKLQHADSYPGGGRHHPLLIAEEAEPQRGKALVHNVTTARNSSPWYRALRTSPLSWPQSARCSALFMYFPLPPPYLFSGNPILDPKLLESVNETEAGCSGHRVLRKHLQTGDKSHCPLTPVSVPDGNA